MKIFIRWMFSPFFIVFSVQLACVSPEKSVASYQEEKYIHQNKVEKILNTPSESENSKLLVTNNGNIYFYSKNTLWRTMTSGQTWKALYKYQPESLLDSDINAITKVIVSSPKLIWLVFPKFVLKSLDEGESWIKVKPSLYNVLFIDGKVETHFKQFV